MYIYLILNFRARAWRLCRLCAFSAARKHRTVEQNARIHCSGRSGPPVRSKTLLEPARSRRLRSKTLLGLPWNRRLRSKTLLELARNSQPRSKTLLWLPRNRRLRSKTMLELARSRQSRSKTLLGLPRSCDCARKIAKLKC